MVLNTVELLQLILCVHMNHILRSVYCIFMHTCLHFAGCRAGPGWLRWCCQRGGAEGWHRDLQ